MSAPATAVARAPQRSGSPLPRFVTHWLLNLYPPYLGTGIRVRHIAKDWRQVVVEMPLRWYNRNAVGTHFGGSLSSMTDPFYMLMVMNNLGPDYVVWDRHGTIDYRKPGRGRVSAEFHIDAALLEMLRTRTAHGDPCYRKLAVDVVDEADEVVAHVTRTLYVRRKSASSASGWPAQG